MGLFSVSPPAWARDFYPHLKNVTGRKGIFYSWFLITASCAYPFNNWSSIIRRWQYLDGWQVWRLLWEGVPRFCSSERRWRKHPAELFQLTCLTYCIIIQEKRHILNSRSWIRIYNTKICIFIKACIGSKKSLLHGDNTFAQIHLYRDISSETFPQKDIFP